MNRGRSAERSADSSTQSGVLSPKREGRSVESEAPRIERIVITESDHKKDLKIQPQDIRYSLLFPVSPGPPEFCFCVEECLTTASKKKKKKNERDLSLLRKTCGRKRVLREAVDGAKRFFARSAKEKTARSAFFFFKSRFFAQACQRKQTRLYAHEFSRCRKAKLKDGSLKRNTALYREAKQGSSPELRHREETARLHIPEEV